MADDELAIIPFITHKLPIVLSTSHRITVLRRGRVIARVDTASATEQSLAREMVGREVMFQVERPVVATGKPVLQVENLSALSSRGFMAVKDVSFTVREGEIFGIAGVSGNGQHELAEVLAGLRKAEAGTVTLDGNEITDALPLKRWQAGLGYIPSERNEVGSIGDFSLVENVAMNYYFDEKFTRRGVVDYASIRKLTEELIADYGVATPNADVKARNLSGGNLQKVILARVPEPQPAAGDRQPADAGPGCGRDRVRPEQADRGQEELRRCVADLRGPGRDHGHQRLDRADVRRRVYGDPAGRRG